MNRATPQQIQEQKDFWESMFKKGYRCTGFNLQDGFTIYYPEFIAKYLQPSPLKNLFEVGCGWGKQTKIFASMFGNVIASDISPTIIEIAKERCFEHKNIIYCEYPNDLDKINLKFQCLFSYGTFQLCTNEMVITMLEDVTKSMESNGKFILEFQMFDSARTIQKEVNRELGRHDMMRNPHEIRELLNNTDLIMDGYELVLKPALQVWAYGHKK